MSDSGFGAPPPPPPPPSAGGGGSIPQRGVGDIISTAFDIYKANATNLLTIVAIVVVPLSFIGAFLTGVVFSPDTVETTDVFGNTVEISDTSFGLIVGGAIVGALIAVVISAVLQAAIMRGAALASVGDPLDVEASYRYGFRKLGSVILISILVGLAVAFGFVLLIIPGIIFLVKFSVSIPALVVEDRRGTDAMSRSWNITKGFFWHALGVIVVAYIVTAVVNWVFAAIGAIFGDLWIVSWIFSAAGQIITAPFTALVSILLYIDLRARSEALTGDTLRSELARTA